MQTERIYYENGYETAFTAVVEEIREDGQGLWVRLNRTAFYPEGGGQPSDTGALEWKQSFEGTCQAVRHRCRVTDVRERENEVWHRLELPGAAEASRAASHGLTGGMASLGFDIGTAVSGEINWERRLDLMQQHSGEHIVSGLIHARYGYDNVGFHLTTDSMTIDLSGEISWDGLMEIEAAANRLIRADRPVEITYPSAEELARIPYRSKKELSGQVRIVTIPDGDICACCGTHVSRTGEIGLIKITAAQKWKSGVRVWLYCGERAEEYCRMLQEQNHRISASLSAKPDETANAVDRVSAELAQTKADLTGWKYRLYAEIAGRCEGSGDTVLFEDGFSMEDIRHLADRVMDVCRGTCFVFSGSDGDGYRYAVGKRGGDVRGLVKEMNGALSGRGGGKPEMAQGTLQAAKSEIESWISRRI